MELLTLLGFASALIIGISLGLIGGGGSILTVPILVYFLGVEASEYAPAYSLFIVGATSLVGSVQKFREDLVDMRTFFVFGIPSIIAVYLTRHSVVPAIPDIIAIGGIEFSKRLLIMGLFAVLMVLASFSMIKTKALASKQPETPESERKFNYPLILAEGVVVGGLTGLVGAGGGFLIIPALVKFSGLSMKKAVGTSLLIIAAKSLFGFMGDAQRLDIEWGMIGLLTALAIGGIFAGNRMSRNIPGHKLERAFGIFVLIMGVAILYTELR